MDKDCSHRKQGHQKRPRWKLTFLGGSSQKSDDETNKAKFSSQSAHKSEKSEQVFPLSNTLVSDSVVIVQFLSLKSIMYRLSKMGLNLGSEVRVISKTQSGSVIVSIQDQHIQ